MSQNKMRRDLPFLNRHPVLISVVGKSVFSVEGNDPLLQEMVTAKKERRVFSTIIPSTAA